MTELFYILFLLLVKSFDITKVMICRQITIKKTLLISECKELNCLVYIVSIIYILYKYRIYKQYKDYECVHSFIDYADLILSLSLSFLFYHSFKSLTSNFFLSILFLFCFIFVLFYFLFWSCLYLYIYNANNKIEHWTESLALFNE